MTPTGWQCPQCKRVYAPHVDRCPNCKPPRVPYVPTVDLPVLPQTKTDRP